MSKRASFRDILSRRDPHGFYVIPLKKEAEELLSKLLSGGGEIRTVDVGDVVLVRVKSRSIAEKIVKMAEKKRLLAEEEEL
ncbi:MAG: hypothetical protein QXN05_02010 [Acidilobaceae archaeon]